MTHPHWDMVLTQCGRGLDSAIRASGWAEDCEIRSGRDYLTTWIASLKQQPHLALPYLFFYGPQNCGKSMFNEAISLLLGDKAIQADLVFQRPFNSELEGALFCWVEEWDDFSKPSKLQLLMDYVTLPFIKIHTKGRPSRSVRNLTHWCQTSWGLDRCPDLPSQWITTIPVPPLDMEIPKGQLLQALKAELPAFRETVLTLWVPQPYMRSMTCMPTMRGAE